MYYQRDLKAVRPSSVRTDFTARRWFDVNDADDDDV